MREPPRNHNKMHHSVEQTQTAKSKNALSLLQKELIVNHSEQLMLKKRMQLMQEFMNDLPSHDPQYSMIAVAIQADKIELDELQLRANALLQKME